MEHVNIIALRWKYTVYALYVLSYEQVHANVFQTSFYKDFNLHKMMFKFVCLRM